MDPLIIREPLRTERLTLRVWRDEDVPAMYAICQDPEIQRWTGLPSPFGIDDASTYVNVTLAAQLATGTGVSFAIEINTTGEIAGSVGLYGISERGPAAASLGLARVWLGPGHRNGGVATEAVRTMASWAFTELGLDRIATYSVAGNVSARRVTERVGFRTGTTLRSAVLHDGGLADLWYSDLIPADLGLAPRPVARG